MIDSKKPAVVTVAVSGIEAAAEAAANIINQAQALGIERLVYLYDHKETQRWFPLYAVTRKRGIVADKPYLIALEKFDGLSVGGAELQDSANSET